MYLEDLQPGMRFSSQTHALDAGQITGFAERFDPQPFHLDHDAAALTLFGGLAASGWHTAAITMKLLVTSPMIMAGGLVGAGAEIAWPNPTRPDDVLHVESEIVSVTPSRSRADRGMVLIRSQTLNQHGVIAQTMLAKLVVPRRPAPAEDPRQSADPD
jgi:acyl dehydratase